MFTGHYAVALAAKPFAPKTSLGTLFLAVQLADLLWPIFLLLGLEHVRIDPGNTRVTPLDFYDYPISHSLLGLAGWAAALALAYYAVRRYPRGAGVVAAAVLSHWLLDALTHRPDMPIVPGADVRAGLGAWNSFAATWGLELGFLAVGLGIYLRVTEAMDRVGRWALIGLVALLLAILAGNLLGPPPPSESAVAMVTLLLWLFVPWGYWIDRHRRPCAAVRDT